MLGRLGEKLLVGEFLVQFADLALQLADVIDIGAEQARLAKEIDKLVHEVSLGIITDVSQVGGYPEYNGQPYEDSDGDGMPNDWEKRYGLNPNEAADAASDLNGDGYTNIEDFINGIDPSKPARKWNAPRTHQDLWSTDPDLRARLERK